MAAIHQLMLSAPRQFLLVGEETRLDDYRHNILNRFQPQTEQGPFSPFQANAEPTTINALWKTSTQVNFCARAYATVPSTHQDSAALTVLGGFLRNGYLHTAIREQGGAYGGGASQDNQTGAFRFFSYRDPRNKETLADFDQSVQWLLTNDHDYQPLEEAILGVISAIDKPASPAGEAKQTFHAELFGNTREVRESFRQRVLEVTIDDLKKVASTYLTPEKANTAIVTNPEQVAALENLGMTVETL
jgi:Zn-dependent M16 (insulinase) family peptidase